MQNHVKGLPYLPSLGRHGRGLAGAGDTSHIECVVRRSALWYFFLRWSLPVLRRWSSPLVASICSVWSSAWLYLNDWWIWLFSSSGTAAGCLSWEVWWPVHRVCHRDDPVHRVCHSPVCQILLQIVMRVVSRWKVLIWSALPWMKYVYRRLVPVKK